MEGDPGGPNRIFALWQARFLAAGGRMPQDPSTRWTRLWSAFTLVIAVALVAVGGAWLAGGTEAAIVAAVLCAAALSGFGVASIWRRRRRDRDEAITPDREWDGRTR